ncbi:MAG: hypothetical protein AAF639_42185 [Chloroflexota bacterium]
MFSESSRKWRGATIVKGLLICVVMLCVMVLYVRSGHTIDQIEPVSSGACEAVVSEQVYRFVEGIDDCLVPLDQTELDALGDPFATALLKQGIFPETTDELDQAIQETLGYNPTVYLIGEGTQVPISIASREENRFLRFTILWGADENDTQIMVSTLAPATGSTGFELISFDPNAWVYNYYTRKTQVSDGSDEASSEGEELSVWTWVGDTTMAHQAETMNQSCFQCHHNGLPIMRELEEPWANWHSQHGSIASLKVPAEIASDPFFFPRRGAEVMEGNIRANLNRYYETWLDQRMEQRGNIAHLVDVDQMLRHVTTNTTVNFKSSRAQSAGANTGPSDLDITGVPPRDTFLADTLLQNVLGLDYTPLFVSLPRDEYDAYLAEHNFRIEGTESFGSGPVTYESPGSTHFAFYVPQIAAEDIYMTQLLLQSDVVNEKFVAATLMVDYQNPLFSEKRASLQHYVDAITEGTIIDQVSSIPADIVAAIEATGAMPCNAESYDDCSAEEQFLYTWNLPDDEWKETVAVQLQAYVDSFNELPIAELLDTLMRWSVDQRDLFLATPRLCNLSEVSAHFPKTDLAEFPPCTSEYDAAVVSDAGDGQSGDGQMFQMPGFVNDFLPSEQAEAARLQERWNDYLFEFTERSLQNDPWRYDGHPGEAMSYFNPATTTIPEDAPSVLIPWTVYPNRIKFYYPDATREELWAYADDGPPPSPDPDNYSVSGHRDWQDEYGEWSVRRNEEGKISRVQFTTETREYWYALWDVSPRAVLRLYRQLASEEVQLEDLYLRDDEGNPVIDPQTGRPAYDGFNKWNGQEGGHAVHMIATFNFYGGALFLSAQSTVLREDEEGEAVMDPYQLLNCGWHGTPYRNSDPFISEYINDLVRGVGVQITLDDPIGVYLQEPNFDLYQLPPNAPEGAHPSDYWKVVRGRARQDGESLDYITHVVFEVPEEHGFSVGDIRINGFPIEYGAQLAETLNVAVAARGMALDEPAQPQSCVSDGSMPYPALLREEPLLRVADRSMLMMRIEQGTTIEGVALKASNSTYHTDIQIVDEPGVTVAKTGFQEEDGKQMFMLTITAAEDAPLGERSVLMTNGDGEGLARFGMIEVVAPGTLGYSATE